MDTDLGKILMSIIVGHKIIKRIGRYGMLIGAIEIPMELHLKFIIVINQQMDIIHN